MMPTSSRPGATRTDTGAFWDDLNRDLEDPAIHDAFIAAADAAANAVSPEEFRAQRNKPVGESSAEFIDEARRNA